MHERDPKPQNLGLYGSREFFTANPQSNEIRTVSLAYVSRLRALSHDPRVYSDERMKIRAYAELEHLEGLLLGLGIRPSMHTGEIDGNYQEESLVAAQLLASMLLNPLIRGKSVISETTAMNIAKEIGTGVDIDSPLVDEDDIPQALKQYRAVKLLTKGITQFFVAAPEETRYFPLPSFSSSN